MKFGGKPLRRVAFTGVVLAPVLCGCLKPIDQVCASYGFSPGTDSFSNCMLEQQKMRMQAVQMLIQNQQQQQILQQQQMQAIQNNRPRTTTTDCYPVGIGFSCNSTSP